MKKLVYWLFLPLVIFGLNLFLIYPYLAQSTPGWIESIEVSFITISRWWAENFPHLSWNPYWYAGFPHRFSYVPLLPWLTAILGRLIGDFGQAYHLLAGVAYSLVPVSLYFFIRYLVKNSWTALLGAFFLTAASSLGNIFAHVRSAQGFFNHRLWAPWRLIVMVYYGEGPHTLAQVFLPLAGLFYLRALKGGKRRDVVLAAVSIALVALSNPIGLWAAGILLGSGFLVFLFWKKDYQKVIGKTAVVAGLAYLLVAFVYSLGFIKSDLMGEGGGLLSQVFAYFPWAQVAAILFFALVLALLRRFVRSPLLATAFLWFILVTLIVTIFYWFEVELAPQARRYIPEMDMAAATVLAILLTKLLVRLRQKQRLVLALAGAGLGLGLVFKTAPATHWLTETTNMPRGGNLETRMNQFLTERVNEGERVFVSSNYTFWLGMGTDLWQLRGGHWQASTHPWEAHAGYQITSGPDVETSFSWLKAFAIKWLVVSKAGSWLHYADYLYPDKFDGFLSREGWVGRETEVVYQVPLEKGMAGSVSLASAGTLREPVNGADKEALAAYVAWLEESEFALDFRRVNNDHYEIEGEIEAGQGVRVAMSYDRGFRAYDEAGRRLKVRPDILGFLLIEPEKEGLVKISLRHRPTADFYLGLLLTVLGVGWITFGRERAKKE
jgi:hypothetical protein